VLIRQYKSSIPALITLIVLSFVVNGQSTTQLTGFVFDQSGAAIENATLNFVESNQARTQHTTSTDNTGYFLFENVRAAVGD
jgi:hypothetical protein